jgi:hypothetical protein
MRANVLRRMRRCRWAMDGTATNTDPIRRELRLGAAYTAGPSVQHWPSK